MSPSRHAVLAAALLFGACIAPSHATVTPLVADGQWSSFDVDALVSQSFGSEWIDASNSLSPGYGTPLEFSFTIGAGMTGTLTVVDAGFAGDTFTLSNFGQVLGHTSSVPLQSFENAAFVGTDFDGALADASFSRGVFTLGPGSYRIGGWVDQSVFADAATVGALRLSVAAVPEPSTWAMFVAGLALVGFTSRRRRG
jgi:PEP-CTERM motif-containing protein